jgi:hypothetical protein
VRGKLAEVKTRLTAGAWKKQDPSTQPAFDLGTRYNNKKK